MKKILLLVLLLLTLLILEYKVLLPFINSRYKIFSSQNSSGKKTILIPFFTKKENNFKTNTPSPTTTPATTLTPIPKTIKKEILIESDSSQPWGISQQIGEHTWTIKVGQDQSMSTPSELLKTLNDYRIKNGSQPLNWNQTLADYANSRAVYFSSIKKLDSHQGFNNFLNDQDGFNKLGFNSLGENASFGYQLNGVHLVEWVYAGDEPHDRNQLDNRWDSVGIGIVNTATCLIFATGKM